jgi:uncharacterized protein YbjT (DUF2867 family)
MKVLVTGASGYIGGRLVPALLAEGHSVRCMSRNPAKLSGQPWFDDIEVVRADAFDRPSLDRAMEGCNAAFYLIHSMGGDAADFDVRDRQAAQNFADAAADAELDRIVYLGGLGAGDELSKHLSSRHEVGRTLASGPVAVTELRAAVIIGSGSVSFEMMRHLTEVLPVMVTPTWVRTRCQPIAITDVLKILIAAIEDPEGESHIWEIGGPDQLTYEDMMRVYAEVAGLPRRVIIPVPVLSPGLSKHWIGLVTPLPAGVAKPLVASLKNEVTVADNTIAETLAGSLTGYRDSVSMALRTSEGSQIATRWSDATASPAEPLPTDPEWAGAAENHDERTVDTSAPSSDVFWAFTGIGGNVGYYSWNWAWKLRGIVDSLIGGVGLRRGRRHPEDLRIGEAVDFWRVSSIDPGRFLQLHAEMKLPGDAWLEFEVETVPTGRRLRQKASFYPRGLFGRLYWLALTPFHRVIFAQMARGIVDAAESRAATGQSPQAPRLQV